MVLMEKDNSKKYVPDVFVEQHLANGYRIVGEDVEVKASEVQAPEEEVQDTKPKTTKKRKS